MNESLDGGYSLEAFAADLKLKMEGLPSYSRDARYVNRSNDIVRIVKDNIVYRLKEYFTDMRINGDAIKVTHKDNGNLDIHFEDDIVETPAELSIFIERYTDVMGELPPMTMTFDKPITRQIITVKVEK